MKEMQISEISVVQMGVIGGDPANPLMPLEIGASSPSTPEDQGLSGQASGVTLASITSSISSLISKTGNTVLNTITATIGIRG